MVSYYYSDEFVSFLLILYPRQGNRERQTKVEEICKRYTREAVGVSGSEDVEHVQEVGSCRNVRGNSRVHFQDQPIAPPPCRDGQGKHVSCTEGTLLNAANVYLLTILHLFYLGSSC